MEETLTKKTVRGAAWTGISKGLAEAIKFVSVIVLARVLLPGDFGILAMAAIVMNIALRVIDAGFSEAVVQRKDLTESHLSTAFWFVGAMGAVVCLITVAVSPLVAQFFKNEQVGPVLSVSSITFFLMALGSIHGALLKRRLQFFKSALADVLEIIGYSVTAVSLALAGFGLWSLVIGNLADCAILMIARWFLSGWRPSFTFSRRHFKDLFQFGIKVTGTRLVSTLGTKTLDALVVGRFLSVASLGFYSMASRGANLVSDILYFVTNRVAVPAFSLLQGNNDRLQRGFLKSMAFTALIGLPLFIGLPLIGKEFVSVFFGEKWLPCVLPMQILCIGAGIGMLNSGASYAFMGIGRPDINLKMVTLQIGLLIPLALIGVKYGAVGVATAVSVVDIVVWFTYLIIVRRVLGIRFVDWFVAIRSPISATLIMAVVLFLFRQYLLVRFGIPDIWSMVCLVALGGVVYLSALKIAGNDALSEITMILQEMMKSMAGFLTAKLPYQRKAAARREENI